MRADSPALAAVQRLLVRLVWLGLVAHAVFLPISIAGMQIGLAVALLAVIGLAATGRRPWKSTMVTAPVVILCAGAMSAIAIPWLAGFPPTHPMDVLFWRGFAAPLAVVLALEAGPEGEAPAVPRRRALMFLALWAAAALLPSAVAWVQVRTGFDPNYALGLRRIPRRAPAPDAPGRFAALGFFTWYTRLSYAMTVVAAFAGALALFAPVSRKLRLLFGASALAASSALVLGGARAGWGALSVVAVVLAFLAGKRVARIAVPLALVASLAAGVASPGLRARLVRLATSEEANGDRTMTWRVCAELVREHPWTGIGFNALGVRIVPYFDRFAPTGTTRDRCHDVLFSAWAEGGPLFAGAVAAWWILLFGGILRLRRSSDELGRAATAGVLAGLAGLFVLSLVHDLIWASEAAFAIGGLVGAGVVLARPREARRSELQDTV
ncbi:MAG TPA: O-antigen ligase family protein [Anaeromyxobacteraceae bacterium]